MPLPLDITILLEDQSKAQKGRKAWNSRPQIAADAQQMLGGAIADIDRLLHAFAEVSQIEQREVVRLQQRLTALEPLAESHQAFVHLTDGVDRRHFNEKDKQYSFQTCEHPTCRLFRKSPATNEQSNHTNQTQSPVGGNPEG